MPGTVKAPLRPFEYMAWAQSVPRGARYNLTASGMVDTTTASASGWDDALSVEQLGSREEALNAIEEFVAAIARRYDVDPSQVTPTLGASLAITHALLALIRAGDHVIVERPTYEVLHRAPALLGAQVSRLERTFEDGWAVVPDRLAQLLTSRTRAVILSNLHNPSGVAADAEAIKAVAELASRVGAVVLVDEVYLDFAFSAHRDARIRPACTIAPNCISWSSTTKAFGFSSLRAGWIVAADPDAAKSIRLATDYLHVYPPVASVMLARRVLERATNLTAHATQVGTDGKNVVERWLEGESRVRWVTPSFGLTGLIRLPELTQDMAFAEHLRERYDTQVVPGSMFEAPGYVRLSFGLPEAQLRQALSNVSSALDDLG